MSGSHTKSEGQEHASGEGHATHHHSSHDATTSEASGHHVEPWRTELLHIGIVLAAWLVILLIFTKDFSKGLGLFSGMLFLGFLPGYLLGMLLLPEWGSVERSILAMFLGIGLAPMLVYILSVLGLAVVRVWFSVGFGLLALGIILSLRLLKE